MKKKLESFTGSNPPACSLPSASGISSDCYTCRFADGRFPTINGKIANFETIEKARKEAKRWGAVQIVICRQQGDGSWAEHATADIEVEGEKPWDCCPAEVEATLKNWPE